MKRANKGFSLVELIIVIAIMAILIGVLAPQYMKYIEKSKKAKDEQLADTLYKLACTIVTDEDYCDDIKTTDWITLDKSKIDTNSDVIKNKALPEFISGWPSVRLRSKQYKDMVYVIKFTTGAADTTKAFSEGWYNQGDPAIPSSP